MLRAIRFAPLLLVLAACGGSAEESSVPSGGDEAALETATIPLGSYKMVRKSGTSRPLARLTLERDKKFSAEMVIEGRGNPLVWWAPAPSETKIVKGTYRTTRERPSVMDPDQRVRDGIWLDYEDPTYSYDHFSYEIDGARLTLKNLDKEIVLERDDNYRAPAEPPPIELSCTTDRGEATLAITLDENQRQRGKLVITRNRMERFPNSGTIAIGYDNRISDEERADYRGIRGDEGFDVKIPRKVIDGSSRAQFDMQLLYEPDQGGSETGFAFKCKVGR